MKKESKKESKHIIYLDANNLYGCVISNHVFQQADSNG